MKTIITLPNLDNMSFAEITAWIESLTTEIVLANLAAIVAAISERFGNGNFFISTATEQPPKLIMLDAA